MMAPTPFSAIACVTNFLVADVSSNELYDVGNCLPEARRQVVENDGFLAGLEKFKHHVTAYVPSATRDQDAHHTHSKGERCGPSIFAEDRMPEMLFRGRRAKGTRHPQAVCNRG